MKETVNIKINQLPSKTWHWLKLNETNFAWTDEAQDCTIVKKKAQKTKHYRAVKKQQKHWRTLKLSKRWKPERDVRQTACLRQWRRKE